MRPQSSDWGRIALKGCDVETNIIHFSVFVPALSPGSYIAEHTYIKCSATTAENIVQAVSDINSSMIDCLRLVRFLVENPAKMFERFGGYAVIGCKDNPPTLDMYLLNGHQNGTRLSHVVCFITDREERPVESTIYRLGEVRVPERAKL